LLAGSCGAREVCDPLSLTKLRRRFKTNETNDMKPEGDTIWGRAWEKRRASGGWML